ncbi:hemolysin family protein [Acidiphilium sp. PA]|uniref:hemolysin family protein n=1 Tax=Acidiphilium sp. PA TaxID=2871705 RepID=UPI0022434012|nr:hemolysin family protein [Acidiphilium sp. PA]MCW8306314.1 hemolysin family protein [Acidiphilium sp. PA]
MSGSWFTKLLHKIRDQPDLRQQIGELMEEANAEIDAEDGGGTGLDRQERALIANVLRLRGFSADDVMIPRADIIAMRADVTLDQAIDQMRREGHSRMPVFGEHLDDILGMVHVKDVLGYTGKPEAFNLRAILRKPLMVAPQIPVLDLLLQMRQRRIHLALVIDEYGGVDGLVTIEDLVETIVGDIDDEHDEIEGPMITEREDGSIDLNARLPIEDFIARYGDILTEEERETDLDTVGGLVFTLAGRVPTRGEILRHPSGLEFLVLDADARRIRRLRARQITPPPAV